MVSAVILRLLCAQILRHRQDLLHYVYESYVKFNTTANTKRIRELLNFLLASGGVNFLVLDGIDEYSGSDQIAILDEISRLLRPNSHATDSDGPSSKLKVLFCSRETKDLLRHVKKRFGNAPVLNLSQERNHISRDIATFTRANMELGGQFEDEMSQDIGNSIVEKADGEEPLRKDLFEEKG